MHEIYQIKDMLKEELKALTQKGELTAGSLETVDKLLNSIKNACKIIMYEEYSDEGDYSRARGRGSNASRDSRGRYSSEGYSSRRYSRDGGYSYGDNSGEIVEALRQAMEEAETEQEKSTIRKMIRRMEQG